MAKKTSAKTEAKIMVARAYWQADQAYKLAEVKRGNMRDLALVAIPKGETVGPVKDAIARKPELKSTQDYVMWFTKHEDDSGVGHYLTHGEKERVEITAVALWNAVADTTHMTVGDVMAFCSVNTAMLKEQLPKVYDKLLRAQSTKRTKHDCLTWSEKGKRI